MIKKVGALAAGVAAVSLLRPTSGQAAIPFNGGGKEGATPDATGGNFIIGQANVASSSADITSIINPGATLSPILFRADNYATGLFAPISGSIISIVGHATDASGATPTAQTYYGVYGQAQSSTGSAKGVYGLAGTVAAPSGVGVTGVGGIGVSGVGSGSGYGVNGTVTSTSTFAYAVRGVASSGAGAYFSGGKAAIVTAPGTGAVGNPNTEPPPGGSEGDLYRGSANGELWYNAGGTNPYRKLAGTSTAGAVHILATPARYVDTRNGSGGATGAYTNGEVRSYDFDSLSWGSIPTGARGVFGNITAVAPGGTGNFQINSSNSFPAGSASVMNFAANVNLSNHFVGALDTNAQLFVKANVLNGSGQVQLVIDIQGYFI